MPKTGRESGIGVREGIAKWAQNAQVDGTEGEKKEWFERGSKWAQNAQIDGIEGKRKEGFGRGGGHTQH